MTGGACARGLSIRPTRRPMCGPAWAYRSKANEAYLEGKGKVSRIDHKKPRGRPMPKPLARGNAAKSKMRVRVEHVFVEQKDRMGLFIRTIGIKRAEAGRSHDHTGQHGLQHEALGARLGGNGRPLGGKWAPA